MMITLNPYRNPAIGTHDWVEHGSESAVRIAQGLTADELAFRCTIDGSAFVSALGFLVGVNSEDFRSAKATYRKSRKIIVCLYRIKRGADGLMGLFCRIARKGTDKFS